MDLIVRTPQSDIPPLVQSEPPPPIHRLSNDVLLEVFKIVACHRPLYLTPAIRTMAAWQLPQVCHSWRSIAALAKFLWNEPHFEFNSEPFGSEGLAHILKRCHEYEHDHGRGCVTLKVTIVAKTNYVPSQLERHLYRWITTYPNGIDSLCVQGTGASEALQRMAYAGPLTDLRCLRIRLVRRNELPLPERDYEVVPLLLSPASGLRRLECVSQCVFDAFAVNHHRLTVDLLTQSASLPDCHDVFLTHIEDVRLVDCPHVLQYVRGASLTSLDFTCTMTFFQKEELLLALVGVIATSSRSIKTLQLHGWLPWADSRLLHSVANARNLQDVTIDFYATPPMMFQFWDSVQTKRHIKKVNACWEVVCHLPFVQRLSIFCSIYCDAWSYRDIDSFRVTYVMKPLKQTVQSVAPHSDWKLGHRRADVWHGISLVE